MRSQPPCFHPSSRASAPAAQGSLGRNPGMQRGNPWSVRRLPEVPVLCVLAGGVTLRGGAPEPLPQPRLCPVGPEQLLPRAAAEPSCAQRCLRSASLVRKCPGISACRRGASRLMRDLLCCFCCDLETGLRKQNPVREQLSPAVSGGTKQLSGANSIQLLRFCCFSRAFKAVLSLCISTCATENFNPSPPDGYLKTHSPLTKPPCSAGPQAPRFPPLRRQVILLKKKRKRTQNQKRG